MNVVMHLNISSDLFRNVSGEKEPGKQGVRNLQNDYKKHREYFSKKAELFSAWPSSSTQRAIFRDL